MAERDKESNIQFSIADIRYTHDVIVTPQK